MNDIIIQFAILWGETIGSALSVKELEIAKEMKAYDSTELTAIFTNWTKEFTESNIEHMDINDFFEHKLIKLIHNTKENLIEIY